MSIRDRLAQLIAAVGAGGSRINALEPRHARRERSRRRHRDTHAPLWPASERHENPDGAREVQDLAPGTPGAPSSRRRIGGGG